MIDDAARLALAHLDLHLREPQPAAQGDESRFDLRVVVWVLDREELDSGAIEGDEPGRGVRDLLATEERHELREHADPHAPGKGRPVGPTGIDEA